MEAGGLTIVGPPAPKAGERSGVRTKLRNTLVAEWGFPEPCAEDVIQHAARLAGPEAERRGGFLRRSE